MDIVLNTSFNNPNLPVVERPGFFDDFNRASADTLGGTSREGRLWNNFDIGANASVWGPKGDGTATMKTAGSSWQIVGVDGLASDGTISAVLASFTGSRWGGLAFRVLDGNNHLRVAELSGSSSRIVLQKRSGGSTTTIATSQTLPQPGGEISVSFVGTQVEVKYDGATIITASDSEFVGETVHGFYAQSSAVFSWDSIEFAV